MTCIAGFACMGVVYMAADSSGVTSTAITEVKDPKVFKKREFIFGYTTSFRFGQIIKYHFIPPDIPDDIDLLEYMISRFVPSFISCMEDHKFTKVDSDGDLISGSVLIGVKGRLFSMNIDFSINEFNCGYHAIGAGKQFALGSMFTSCVVSNNGDAIVTTAIEAAAKFSPKVVMPVNLISI